MSALATWARDASVRAAWVRQAGPFPYRPVAPHLPSAPEPAILAQIADDTDRELRALFERLRTYAAADRARDDVEGLLAIARSREQSLGAAVRELAYG